MGPAVLPTTETQETPMPIDLSQREWQLLEAMRLRETPFDTAQKWGTTRQNVDNVRRELERKGAIIRRKDVPWWMFYSDEYPWVIPDGLEVRYEPALPPNAELRAIYPRDSVGDMTVAPIRIVRWDDAGWTVQGLPTARRDGKIKAMLERVVWCIHDDDRSWSFPAWVEEPWMESFTREELTLTRSPDRQLVMDPELLRAMTEMIAAVIGVPAVLDITAAGEVAVPRPAYRGRRRVPGRWDPATMYEDAPDADDAGETPDPS